MSLESKQYSDSEKKSSDLKSSATPSLLVFRKNQNQFSERSIEMEQDKENQKNLNQRQKIVFNTDTFNPNDFKSPKDIVDSIVFNTNLIKNNIGVLKKNNLAKSAEVGGDVRKINSINRHNMSHLPEQPKPIVNKLNMRDEEDIETENEFYDLMHTNNINLQTNPTKDYNITEDADITKSPKPKYAYEDGNNYYCLISLLIINCLELLPTQMGNDLINNGRMKNKLAQMATLETNSGDIASDKIMIKSNINVNVDSEMENYKVTRHIDKDNERDSKKKNSIFEDRKSPIFHDSKRNKDNNSTNHKILIYDPNNVMTDLNDDSDKYLKKIKKNDDIFSKNKNSSSKLVIKENKQKSKNDNNNKDSKAVDEESVINYEENDEDIIEYPYRICFICDNYRESSQVFYGECCHYFCWKCGKKYYESKIDKNDYNFKCPLFKCQMPIKIQMIMKIISDSHYEKLVKDQNEPVLDGNLLQQPSTNLQKVLNLDKENNQNIQTTTGNNIKTTKDNKDNKESKDKSYRVTTAHLESNENMLELKTETKKRLERELKQADEEKQDKVVMMKNLIKIDNFNNDLIVNYLKNKERYCHNCGEPSLFEIRKHIIKCLNCFQVMCKFCMKSYHSDHFDLASFNYCKVYFRSRLQIVDVTSQSKPKEFVVNMIIILISYFIFYFGFMSQIKNWLEEKIDPYGRYKLKNREVDNNDNNINITTSNIANTNYDYKGNSGFMERFYCIKVFSYYIILIITIMIAVVILLLVCPFFPILIALFK